MILKFNPQIEGLRAVAVLGVLIEHLLREFIHQPWLNNLPYGKGVLLFFVISGYLISFQIFQFKEKNIELNKTQWKSIGSFYMRRVLRIFPLYYVLIIILVIIGFSQIDEMWGWLITYNANLKIALDSKYIGNYTHLWSLAVEEKFYLIWVGLLVFIPKKYTPLGFVILSILSLVSKYLFQYYTSIPLAGQMFTISNFFIFIGGGAVAYFQFYYASKFEKLPWKWIGWVTFMYLIILLVIDHQKLNHEQFEWMYPAFTPLITVFFIFLVAIAANFKFKHLIKWLLVNPFAQYLGKISYGIYVFHLFMPPLWVWLNSYLHLSIPPKPMFLILTLMTVGLASLSWFFLEKPILKLKRKFNY